MKDTTVTFFDPSTSNISTVGVSVAHFVMDEDVPLHNHDYNETFIILSGSATHVLGDWEYPLQRGDFLAVKGDIAHGFRNVHNLEIISLFYDRSFFRQAYREIRSIPDLFRSF